jgi:oligosaccharide repeat unit polymerase
MWNIRFSAIGLVFIISICFYAIRRIPREGNGFFDPGFLFASYYALHIYPVALWIGLWGVDVLNTNYIRAPATHILAKIFLCHIIFFVAFTSILCLLSEKHSIKKKYEHNRLIKSKNWILLALAFLILQVGVLLIFGSRTNYSSYPLLARQILSRLDGIGYIAFIFGLGCIIVRSKSIVKARVKLCVFFIGLYAFSFLVQGERSWALCTIIGTGAYAEIARWKGRLLTWKIIIVAIISLYMIVFFSNIYEHTKKYGNAPKPMQIIDVLIMDRAPLMIENAIISWVDNRELDLRYFGTYLNALKGMLPTQFHERQAYSLSVWFARKYNPEGEGGFKWSAVAEGYMNYRIYGVLIHGLILGLLLSGLNRLRSSGKLKTLTPFVYSVLISYLYPAYVESSGQIVSKIKWAVIFVVTLYVIALFLKRPSRIKVVRMAELFRL